MNSPYSTPAPTPTEARPACDGDFSPFDLLIERPNNDVAARHIAERYCGTCALRDTCLVTDDKEWAPAATAIRKQLARIARRRARNAA